MLGHGVRCDEELDRFALIATQHYNFGSAGNWFFNFRVGYFGVRSRVWGLQKHSSSLHTWRTTATTVSHEHDIAVMLFCMDSAIECFVFMLNALGHAVDPAGFRDVASDKALRRINPDDILGLKKPPLSGYSLLFPTTQSYWQAKAELINLIFENHDVTKHRHQAGVTGRARLDPPAGFYEALGIPNDPIQQAIRGPFPPMERILIPKRPKLPIEERPHVHSEWTTLEAAEKEFLDLIPKSFCLALKDAQQNIKLTDPTLHT